VSLQQIILILKYSESIIIQTGKITEICKRTMKVNKTKKEMMLGTLFVIATIIILAIPTKKRQK